MRNEALNCLRKLRKTPHKSLQTLVIINHHAFSCLTYFVREKGTLFQAGPLDLQSIDTTYMGLNVYKWAVLKAMGPFWL